MRNYSHYVQVLFLGEWCVAIQCIGIEEAKQSFSFYKARTSFPVRLVTVTGESVNV